MKLSLFQQVLGTSSRIKVLDFLIKSSEDCWDLVELMKSTHTSYATLKMLIPQLLKEKRIYVHKKAGKAKFYRINEKNPAMTKLIKFYRELTQDYE